MPDTSISLCPECGKQQPSDNVTCWLCGRKLGVENVVTEEQARHLARYARIGESPAENYGTWGALGAALMVLWLLVGFGTFFASPPLAVLFFGITAPIGAVVAIKSRASNREQDELDRLADILLALLQVAGVVVLLLAALFGALLLMCLANPPHFGHP